MFWLVGSGQLSMSSYINFIMAFNGKMKYSYNFVITFHGPDVKMPTQM